MSQVCHLGPEELTLLSLDLQSMLSQLLKHHFQALQVGTDVLAEDYDVIKVHNQDFQQFIAENGQHNPLEHSGHAS